MAHECSIYNMYRPGDLQKGRSLSVRVFSVEGHNTTPEKMRTLQRFGADRLRTEIGKLRYFSSVEVTEETSGDGSDLHLTATIANLDEGSKWRRALARTGAAKVRVTGAVRTKSGEQVFDYECEGAEVGGGIGGFGGLVGNFVDGLFAAFDSSESLLRKSFERFAVDFAKNAPSLNTALQEQLGLKLENQRGAVESWSSIGSSGQRWTDILAGATRPRPAWRVILIVVVRLGVPHAKTRPTAAARLRRIVGR